MMKTPPNTQYALPIGYTPDRRLVSLSGTDFFAHKWVLGSTGSGKSYLLAWIYITLLRQGIGVYLIDPHGDLCSLILEILAASGFFKNQAAYERLWYVDFSSMEKRGRFIPFNALQTPFPPHKISANMLQVFKRLFGDDPGTTIIDSLLLSCCEVLAEHKRPFTDINRLLTNEEYRQSLLTGVSYELIADYVAKQFEKSTSSTESTARRIFLLTYPPEILYTLGQKENRLQFRTQMDRSVSMMFNLSGLDDYTKRFLGCLLLVNMEQSLLSRADIPPETRKPTFIVVDEFAMFSESGSSFRVVLEQLRKYKAGLVLANQGLSQLTPEVKGSLGNAISILMRVSHDDSKALSARFAYQPAPTKRDSFSLGSSLFGEKASLNPFELATTIQERQWILANLQRQQAIVSIDHVPILITTPTLPQVQVSRKLLQSIEDQYAHRLLTPLQDIKAQMASPAPVVRSSSLSAPSVPAAQKEAVIIPLSKKEGVRRAKKRQE